jgi:predicted nucleic acid-binding protein
LSSAPVGAVIVDASVAIAISAKEVGREPKATAEMLLYSTAGYQFYAPGAIIAETLYILCGKLQQGLFTVAEHTQAVLDFEAVMVNILPPPDGEISLIARAEAIRTGYGCSRSADGIYIALAEALARTVPTVIVTFDQDMQNQVTRNAPTVSVHTLTT